VAHLLQRDEQRYGCLGSFGLPHAEEQADGVPVHPGKEALLFINAVFAGLPPGEQVHADNAGGDESSSSSSFSFSLGR